WRSELTLGQGGYDRHVPALDIAGVFEALTKCAQTARECVRRGGGEEPDRRHRRLLRAGRERPRRSCAAEQRDELAAFHSITSSAMATSVGDSSSPSALAVFKLRMNSYLVGCWNGRSPGFS